MKIKVWTRIDDGGDGEHHVSLFSSKSKATEGLELDSPDDDYGFDEYGDLVQISFTTIDTDEYTDEA